MVRASAPGSSTSHSGGAHPLVPGTSTSTLPRPATSGPRSTWVQCDACNKWRRLPLRTASKLLASSSWTCAMNPDRSHSTCESKEEPQPRDEVSVWQVEAILDRKAATDGRVFYLVKWIGYDNGHNSWEPEEEISPALKEAFLSRTSDLSADPYDLSEFSIEEYASVEELREAVSNRNS